MLSGYRYALALTHHEQDAEDLVQHACLKVFRVKGRLADKSYLLTTIRNLFVDVCRRRAVMKIGELTGPDCEDQQPSHVRQVEGQLDAGVLLANLGQSEREVLYLNLVEEYSAAEISQVTGQPRGTVLSQLSRAKQKVRDRYPRLYSEEAI